MTKPDWSFVEHGSEVEEEIFSVDRFLLMVGLPRVGDREGEREPELDSDGTVHVWIELVLRMPGEPGLKLLLLYEISFDDVLRVRNSRDGSSPSGEGVSESVDIVVRTLLCEQHRTKESELQRG